MPLPNTGDLNWGIPLNDYILNEVMTLAQEASDDVAAHLASSADPHGSKAYADSQISAVTSTYDQPNGRAGLGGDGRLKPSQAPTGGGRASIYDVVGDFGAVANGSDQTTKFQNALDAAAAAGGGEVWLGDGVFTVAGTLKIGANTHLHLSNGATIKRASNSVVSTMIRNYSSDNNDSGYGGPGEIMISGGNIDGGGVANAIKVSPLVFGHANNIIIRDVTILNTVDNPAITLAGCRNVVIDNVKFQGLRISNPGVANGNWRQPAVNVDHANVGSLGIGGSFDNTPCENVHIQNCTMKEWGTFKSFGKIVDSRNYVANIPHKRMWVVDNYIYKAHEYAIMIVGVSEAVVRGNTVVDSNGGVYATVPDGWSYGGTGGVLANISISGNTFLNCGQINSSDSVRARVLFVGGINSGSSNGYYTGVSVVDNRILTWSNGRAIEIYTCYQAVCNSNNINYGPHGSSTYGILLTNSPLCVVSGNKVGADTGIGIYVRSGSNDTAVTGNQIYGADNDAIVVESSTKVSFSGNNTSATGQNSIRIAGGGSAFAVGNRWDADSTIESGNYYTVNNGASSGNLGS